AMVSADGMGDTIVFWDGLTPTVIPATVENDADEEIAATGLAIVDDPENPENLLLDAPFGYVLDAPVEVYDGGAACRDYGTVSGYDWSTLPQWTNADVTLTEVRVGIDGCLSLQIEDEFGTASSGFL